MSDRRLQVFYTVARLLSFTKAAEELQPSGRGETEIVDLHNWYLNKGELEVEVIKGEWIDAGTFDSLLKANNFIANRKRQS